MIQSIAKVEHRLERVKTVQFGLPVSSVSITTPVICFHNMPAGCINGIVIKTDDLAHEIEVLASKSIIVGKIDQAPWGKFAAVIYPDENRLSLHRV